MSWAHEVGCVTWFLLVLTSHAAHDWRSNVGTVGSGVQDILAVLTPDDQSCLEMTQIDFKAFQFYIPAKTCDKSR
jgi:hypothetical protein